MTQRGPCGGAAARDEQGRAQQTQDRGDAVLAVRLPAGEQGEPDVVEPPGRPHHSRGRAGAEQAQSDAQGSVGPPGSVQGSPAQGRRVPGRVERDGRVVGDQERTVAGVDEQFPGRVLDVGRREEQHQGQERQPGCDELPLNRSGGHQPRAGDRRDPQQVAREHGQARQGERVLDRPGGGRSENDEGGAQAEGEAVHVLLRGAASLGAQRAPPVQAEHIQGESGQALEDVSHGHPATGRSRGRGPTAGPAGTRPRAGGSVRPATRPPAPADRCRPSGRGRAAQDPARGAG